MRFEFGLPRAGEATLEVFDLAGRRVRVLTSGPRPAGPASVAWDLGDERGTRVRSGVYLVRAHAAGAEAVRRVVVLR